MFKYIYSFKKKKKYPVDLLLLPRFWSLHPMDTLLPWGLGRGVKSTNSDMTNYFNIGKLQGHLLMLGTIFPPIVGLICSSGTTDLTLSLWLICTIWTDLWHHISANFVKQTSQHFSAKFLSGNREVAQNKTVPNRLFMARFQQASLCLINPQWNTQPVASVSPHWEETAEPQQRPSGPPDGGAGGGGPAGGERSSMRAWSPTRPGP